MNRNDYHKPVRRLPSERGSALLIVFVFAALIAIALYKEMPIAAFEARRQKEQTLIDRGHEYQRAVQLYYRKFGGRYPANIDMLENTNNMRFLRRRYSDPFTGKDDWRLLHAGPAGQLMDSKVANSAINGVFGQSGNNLRGNSNATQLGSGFSTGGARNGFATGGTTSSNGTSPTSSSGSGAFGSTESSSSSDSDVVVPPVTKRAPALAANASPSSSQLDQDPSLPLLPPEDPSATGSTGAKPDAAAMANSSPTPAAGTPGAQQPNTPNSMQMVQNLFGSGANQPQQQTNAAAAMNGGAGPTGVSTIGSTGQMSGGSFAGVASKAKGHTIKKVNDQNDYSLWEFWYDPTKDKSMGIAGAQANGNGGQNVQNGTQLGQPASGSFGSTSSSSATDQPAAGTAPTTTPTPAPTTGTTDTGAQNPPLAPQ